MAFSGATPCHVERQKKLAAKLSITYNKLRTETSIKSRETFVAENLLGTIYTVLVEHLANNRRPLILHAVAIK